MEEKIEEILYHNSFDSSEGIVIRFEEIQKVIDLLVKLYDSKTRI